jgi:hypothetical protein
MNSYKNKTKYKTSLPTNLMLKVKIKKNMGPIYNPTRRKQNIITKYNSQNNLIPNEKIKKQKLNRK